jgi:hypothetical protein
VTARPPQPGGAKTGGLDLDKRKAFILATVVYEYVATAEPVGSNTLTQKYNLGVSSATIRNEMAELEAGGYLVQPHTSAGRIPSDAGYRTYVDRLMQPEPLATGEQRRIQDEFRAASRELESVIEQTTRLLGQLSRSVAFVVAPQRDTQAFRHVQLIWLGERTGLAIVVTSLGVATQTAFEHVNLAADDLTRLSNRLNTALAGKTMRQIAAGDVETVVRDSGLPAIRRCIAFRRTPCGRFERGAAPARPARISRPAQVAFHPAHHRGAQGAVRFSGRLDDRRGAAHQDRSRARVGRDHRMQRDHGPVSLR